MTGSAAVSTDRAGHQLPALVAVLRPTQWVKNTLVFAVPLAAGELTKPAVLTASLAALVTFCLASSAGYALNDVVDADTDRHHPSKRQRPVASGALSRSSALALAATLAVASVVGSLLVAPPALTVVLVTYLVLTSAYSLGLKNQAVVDLVVVTLGFLMRAVAGGAAAGLPVSQWFLIVASFGSLYLVAGKRYSEHVQLGELAVQHRPTLGLYSASYLRFVWSVAAGVTITAYCLWAFEVGATHGSLPWAQLSVAPFVTALLRYAVDVDHGRAGSPEVIALRDHVLQALALAWLVLFALAAFGV